MKTYPIYALRFLSNFIKTVFFPFFAIWLFNEKLLSVTEAALVVSIGVLSTRLSGAFLSYFIKQYKKKNVLLVCLCATILIYLLIFTLAKYDIESFFIWAASSLLLGVMLSLITLALLASIAIHTDQSKHVMGFAFVNIALNMSAGIGPFIGAYVLSQHQDYLPLTAILFATVSLLFLLIIFPAEKKGSNIVELKRDFSFGGKNFFLFLLINFFTFIGYAQFYDVFPLFSEKFIGLQSIGTLFLFSSIVISLLQIPLNKYLRRYKTYQTLILSNVLLAIGTMLLLFAQNSLILACFVGVALLSISEVIYGPLYQAMSIKLYNGDKVYALAILSAVWGISESTATFLGLFSVGHGYGTIAILLGVGMAFLAALFCLICRKSLSAAQL